MPPPRCSPRRAGITHSFYNHRYLALPIEWRGVLADYDERKDA